jgi:hypothetical protein
VIGAFGLGVIVTTAVAQRAGHRVERHLYLGGDLAHRETCPAQALDLRALGVGQLGGGLRARALVREPGGTGLSVLAPPSQDGVLVDPEGTGDLALGGRLRVGELDGGQTSGNAVIFLPVPCRHSPEEHRATTGLVLEERHAISDPDGAVGGKRQGWHLHQCACLNHHVPASREVNILYIDSRTPRSQSGGYLQLKAASVSLCKESWNRTEGH